MKAPTEVEWAKNQTAVFTIFGNISQQFFQASSIPNAFLAFL